MARRALIIACSITLVAALLLGALRYLGIVLPDAGPLGDLGGNEIGEVEEVGRSFATPFFGIKNPTSHTLRVESVEVLRAAPTLTILGIGACSPDGPRCLMSTSYRRWPPPQLALRPIDGLEIPPGGSVAVIVGWRAEEPGKHRVRGIELTYRQGIRRFVTEVGPRLVVRARERGRAG